MITAPMATTRGSSTGPVKAAAPGTSSAANEDGR